MPTIPHSSSQEVAVGGTYHWRGDIFESLKHGCPPIKQEKATESVLQQAEDLSNHWPMEGADE